MYPGKNWLRQTRSWKQDFPAGVQIKIPVKYLPRTEVNPVNEDAFISHIVQKGETLYGISTHYHIKIPEIKKYNPALENRDGLLSGEKILIPELPDKNILEFMGIRKEDSARVSEEYYEVQTTMEIPEVCQPRQTKFFFESFRIGLMLPLFMEANDTLNNQPPPEGLTEEEIAVPESEHEIDTVDSVIEDSQQEIHSCQFYQNSEQYLHFYEGVLIAVDSMRKNGMNIELYVFDTKRDKHTVDSLVATHTFLNLDLIIGPIYPNLQTPVADFAAKNRIPMVSPLSSNSSITDHNPFFFQVNPAYDYLLKQTAELIAEEYFDSNFVVFKMNNKTDNHEKLLVQLCHEKLFNSGYYSSDNDVSFRIYNFYNQGSFGIPRILSKEKENVFYHPFIIRRGCKCSSIKYKQSCFKIRCYPDRNK